MRPFVLGLWMMIGGCYASHGAPDAGPSPAPPDTSVAPRRTTVPSPDTRPPPPPDSGHPPDTGSDVSPPRPPPAPVACEAPRPVDVLFVVDDSGSIHDYRGMMRQAIESTIRVLLAPPDRDGDGFEDWPRARDLHLGVTTSSITGGGVCPGALDGRLSRGEYGDDPSCEGPFPNFLLHRGDSEAEETAHDFACMVDGVAPGCTIEQPLEAILKALLPSTTSIEFLEGPAYGDTDNAGFLREGSLLSVVILTDEDDCSIQDPGRLAPVDAGIGPIPPAADAAPPRIDICDDHEELFPIERYVVGLGSLRPADEILVGFVSGWDVPFSREVTSGHAGCADASGWTGAPSRLVELAGNHPRSFAASICKLHDRRVHEGIAAMVAETACR